MTGRYNSNLEASKQRIAALRALVAMLNGNQTPTSSMLVVYGGLVVEDIVSVQGDVWQITIDPAI